MDSKDKRKILIFYSKFGDGHLQAARAIEEAVQLQQAYYQTFVIDFMECLHPLIYPVSRHIYMQGVKNFPSIYRIIFQKTRKSNFCRIFKTLHLSSLRRMLKLLKEIEPSVVVCTFPLAAATMSMLKSYGYTKVPTVTVITDHIDHSIWSYPHIDHYIVGSDPVRQALNRYGVPDEKIAVTGIPIRPAFTQSYSQEQLRKKFGLDSFLPTILVAGGGYGLMDEGVASLLVSDILSQKLQFIIVCGHNEKLKKQLTEKLQHCKHNIFITGYVDYIHELMAASNLIITKAGALTIAEALAMELPMLFYKPIPGHEQENADIFIRAGVARQANHFQELKNTVEEMLNHPHLLQEMKEKTKQFHRKQSAFAALDIIMQT
jgi:processive 1,2-diacylglycerol beta-glucosyltransferase